MSRRNRRKKFVSSDTIPVARAVTVYEAPLVTEPETESVKVEDVEPYVPAFCEWYLGKGTLDDIPESKVPYFIATKEDLFVHKVLPIGRGITPVSKTPWGNVSMYSKTLNNSVEGLNKGVFWYRAPVIPADLCAKIVHWFRRILTTKSAEAEVLLLFNTETQEWRLWIPTQKVTHSSVNSRYEPLNIPDGFTLVGSVHSHCDFGAFHSGTDVGDANDFDGVHITIGMLQNDTPQFATMVMMNKLQFTMELERVADFSQLDAAEAPDWWDEFLSNSQELPKRDGHLFDKYPSYRPVYTPPKTTYTSPYPQWQRPPQTTPHQHQQQRMFGDGWNQNRATPPPTTQAKPGVISGFEVDAEFWEMYKGWRYDTEVGAWLPDDDNDSLLPVDIRLYDALTQKDNSRDNGWNRLPDTLIDSLLNSTIFTAMDEADVEDEKGSPYPLLQSMFMKKLREASNILNELGFDVETKINLKPKKKQTN